MFKKNYGSERVNILAGRQVFHDLSGAMRSNDEQKFMDEIESFAYNCISRKYQIEVTNYQIFLPNEAA